MTWVCKEGSPGVHRTFGAAQGPVASETMDYKKWMIFSTATMYSSIQDAGKMEWR